jgi:RNA polymerase sigma factor (sigma-70 family)
MKMNKPQGAIGPERALALPGKVQKVDEVAHQELVQLLANELQKLAAGKHYFPTSRLRETGYEYLKTMFPGLGDEMLVHRIACDAILKTMAASELSQVARIGQRLWDLVSNPRQGHSTTALLLRLRYVAGLSWPEIEALPLFDEQKQDLTRAALDLTSALATQGLSEEILAEHSLCPRGEVTQLLAEVQKGQRPLGDVVAHQRAKLLRQAEHLLKMERSDISLQAEDLVNEMFLRLPKSPDKSPGNHFEFDALTKRIMRHILIDRIRKPVPGQARISGDLPEHLSTTPPGLEEHLLLEKVLRVVQEVIAELRTTDRETAEMLKAALFRGADQREIAKLHSVSVSTVKRRLKDAREQIRTRLGLD